MTYWPILNRSNPRPGLRSGPQNYWTTRWSCSERWSTLTPWCNPAVTVNRPVPPNLAQWTPYNKPYTAPFKYLPTFCCCLHLPSDLKELLSEGDVENLLQVTGCSAEQQRPSCDSGCLSERYRSITGECNNRSVPPRRHVDAHGAFFPLTTLVLVQTATQTRRRQHTVFPLAASGV